MSEFSPISLRPVRTAGDWAAYHAIRRDAIFALYRPNQTYDPDHADETKPGNLPHVLARDEEIVGVVRIDLLAADHAAFRLVGIRKDVQRIGLGTALLRLAEDVARAFGRCEVVLNSTLPALDFYLANGYAPGDWFDVELLRRDLVRVGKRLIVQGPALRP
jgi:GNAT superfamily N-acetyltransferase